MFYRKQHVRGSATHLTVRLEINMPPAARALIAPEAFYAHRDMPNEGVAIGQLSILFRAMNSAVAIGTRAHSPPPLEIQ